MSSLHVSDVVRGDRVIDVDNPDGPFPVRFPVASSARSHGGVDGGRDVLLY